MRLQQWQQARVTNGCRKACVEIGIGIWRGGRDVLSLRFGRPRFRHTRFRFRPQKWLHERADDFISYDLDLGDVVCPDLIEESRIGYADFWAWLEEKVRNIPDHQSDQNEPPDTGGEAEHT